MRRTAWCLALAALTVVTGVLVRMGPLHLPGVVSKYAGSALYAVMFYWLIAAIRPRWTPPSVAVWAFAAAAAVEFFKLVHTPALDDFRLTLAGKLTPGRVFSPWDLAAYAAGVALAMLADKTVD